MNQIQDLCIFSQEFQIIIQDLCITVDAVAASPPWSKEVVGGGEEGRRWRTCKLSNTM